MIDLNNDWIKKDSASASNIYYGYTTNLSATGSNKVWSIRRVQTSSGVETVSWNKNRVFDYSAAWDDRDLYFTAPTASLTASFTFSKTNVGHSFGTHSFLDLTWSEVKGIDTYQITISDEFNRVYSYNGNQITSPYNQNPITFETLSNSYKFRGQIGKTYSLTLTARNVYGSVTATGSITT